MRGREPRPHSDAPQSLIVNIAKAPAGAFYLLSREILAKHKTRSKSCGVYYSQIALCTAPLEGSRPV